MIKKTSTINHVDGRKVFIVQTLHEVFFISTDYRGDAIDFVKRELMGRFDMIIGCTETVEVHII